MKEGSTMTYHTSNEEHPIDIVNIASLEGRVKRAHGSRSFWLYSRWF